MTDLTGRKVDSQFALHWATKERVKLYEVSATDRTALVDIVHYLVGRHFHPASMHIVFVLIVRYLLTFRGIEVLAVQEVEAGEVKCPYRYGLLGITSIFEVYLLTFPPLHTSIALIFCS